MKTDDSIPFLTHFGCVPDPRVSRTRRYSLPDLLFLCICAVLCGADDCVSIAEFGRVKSDWLAQYTDFRDGLPSHDTISRVLSLLDPLEVERAFVSWVSTIHTKTKGEVIAIDGKTMRRSFDTATGKAAIHMVSAWSSANGLVLGQVETAEKSNEITAIPKLLKMLDIEGCTITIDAMGTQKDIASEIIDKKADYLLPVKDNHPNLNADIQAFFERAMANRWMNANADKIPHAKHRMFDADHGRSETRICYCTDVLDDIENTQDWKGLRTIAMIQAERVEGAKTSTERRYYISSLPPNAKWINDAARKHWGVENGLHWVLDVAFNEDLCRSRKNRGAAIRAVLNRVAVNICKADTAAKVGIKNRRHKAAWDKRYLTQLIEGKKS